MKFLCSHCKAKYQIADEKVAGRTLRMVCRRCQQEIVIRGEPPQPASSALPFAAPARGPSQQLMAPPPSPLGTEFHRQVTANITSPLPAAAVFDEWHVAINDVPVGPIRREEIARKLASGMCNGDSLAWREGMDDWMPMLQIPELAVMFLPRPSVAPPPAPPPPPPLMQQPSQRMEFSPLGGRAGAAPYAAVESWQPAPSWAPVEQSQKISPAPVMPAVLEAQVERRVQGPSWPLMFALACGFALLMSALTIVGAGWLRERPQAAAPVAATAGAAAPAPVKPAVEVPAEEPVAAAEPGVVIGLDEVQGNGTRGTRPKGTTPAPTTVKPGTKKELTAAQKEMLARMGGNTGGDLSGLGTGKVGDGQPTRAAGSLTAAEMMQVVTRGKPNLTRCYETALRGAGSTDTVRLDIEVSVSPSGNVTSVKTTGQGLPGMNNCIERTVKMWRFPASGEAAATRFPLLFQPGA